MLVWFRGRACQYSPAAVGFMRLLISLHHGYQNGHFGPFWDGVVLTHRARVSALIAARGRFLFVRRPPLPWEVISLLYRLHPLFCARRTQMEDVQ